MPNFRKLEPEEVKTIENKGKGQRKLTEEQYDAILADYEVGDYGEAMLDAGDNRLTVRNRLKAAAKRGGVAIDFRRTQGDVLRSRKSAKPVKVALSPSRLPPQSRPPSQKVRAGAQRKARRQII